MLVLLHTTGLVLSMFYRQGFAFIDGIGLLDHRSLVQWRRLFLGASTLGVLDTYFLLLVCIIPMARCFRCFTDRAFPSLMAMWYWIIDPLCSYAGLCGLVIFIACSTDGAFTARWLDLVM